MASDHSLHRNVTIASFSLLLLLLLSGGIRANTEEISKVYIVYLGERKHENPEVVTASHHDMLTTVCGSKNAALDSIVYSYRHGFSGFAAKLTDSQAKLIAEFPEVIHVTASETHELHTTRSWDFLGLNPANTVLLNSTNYGDNVIIGVIDTGIWPESLSFHDQGLGPVPSRWKGECQTGTLFNASHCNRKIIGARYFAKGIVAGQGSIPSAEYQSPRDANGHGTHVASTAAGSMVANASYQAGTLGLGLGRGGAPRARIAVYKACWGTAKTSCVSEDLLAAFDSAIRDGVDIISLSVGKISTPQLGFLDSQNFASIGGFHAVARGITVVVSAGNAGPFPQKVTNGAPWVMTVAASTFDRSFPTAITLGNNHTLFGQSLYFQGMGNRFSNLTFFSSCDTSSLNSTVVSGKIILCFTSSMYAEEEYAKAINTAAAAGGSGVIVAMHTTNLFNPCNSLKRCVQVDHAVGTQILDYFHATRSPIVKVGLPRDVLGKVSSPKVAHFSSRGPNSVSLDILKPDVAAPGVNVLAAGQGSNEYVFMSGTSMACPHVSGIAALLKSLHPNWSPAAIKSAIVTTASVTTRRGVPIAAEGGPRKVADPFDFGGGHVDPNHAAHPGLVYDILGTSDYVQFLCSMGYTETNLRLLTNTSTTRCGPIRSASDLNLPSISISNLKKPTTVSRTVTNVGPVRSTYTVRVEAPGGMRVTVDPEVLSFSERVRSLSFRVTFTPEYEEQGDFSFGSLTWRDGIRHVVRIPLVTRLVLQDSYADIS